jgi:hypothetical protein
VSENSERWQDYPYLVEWVAELKTWAAKYEIYEFIPSDENQEDPTGRIPSVVNAEELVRYYCKDADFKALVDSCSWEPSCVGLSIILRRSSRGGAQSVLNATARFR